MYIVKKKIKGRDYFYLRKSVREGKKVRSKNIAYLGKTRKDAKRKAKEIIEGKKERGIKIIYFVHGTTKDNEKSIATGQAQGELSKLGIKQSKELPKLLKDKKFDVIFCSDLKRAIDSAKISFENKYKIIKDKRLRECDYGDLNQAKREKVIYSKHIETPFPNGESLKDVEVRIKDFLNFLIKKYDKKNIAIVSHRAPQLAIEVLLNKKTWKQAIEEDWRKKSKWQAGWDYELTEIKDKKEKKVEKKEITIENLAAFCKRKGFVFPSSEIYGGFSGFWDFGDLGVELFNNIKQNWWKFFVSDDEKMFGIDSSVISHPKIWKASGHLASFADVMGKCKKCSRMTKLEEGKCECGGDLEKVEDFNLMFETRIGTDETSSISYLRPETAQGMFTDFKLIAETSRAKLPFGIAQIGKSFRNEIAPRDFLFRSREFTIAELEFFIHPKEKKCELLDKEHLDVELKLLDLDGQMKGKEELKKTTIKQMLKEKRLGEWHAYWLAKQLLWFKSLGLNIDKLKVREHTKNELSHYSSATFDIDYDYPFGSKEVAGIADRGQYDLTQHMKESEESLEIFDEQSKKKIIPKVIEPTFGMERVFLALIVDSYSYDEERKNIVLKLNSKLSPIKVAIFPIVKKKSFVKLARQIQKDLKTDFRIFYDEAGSIGRRYSRQDEIGTHFCITVDGESVRKKDVTIRNRNDTEQIRVKIKDLKEILSKLLKEEIKFEKVGRKISTRKK